MQENFAHDATPKSRLSQEKSGKTTIALLGAISLAGV
jgi:hypothetical protein